MKSGLACKEQRSRSDAQASMRVSGVPCVKSTQSAQVSVGLAKRVQHTSIHADNHAHI